MALLYVGKTRLKSGVGMRSEARRLYRGITRRLTKQARRERDIRYGVMFSRWIRYRVMFSRLLEQATPVLVYQMGKVGSTSISRSLDLTYPGISVSTHKFSGGHHSWMVRRLYRAVTAEGAPLDIITLTREPIGRNISAFFENYERDTGVSYRKSNLTVAQLRDLFLANFPHDLPLEWFENHIERNFGIDVYAALFPEKGYATYEKGPVRLLVIKSEIPDAVKEEAIGEFLDLHPFHLVRTNVGEAKEYADQYQAFKQAVRLPSDYVDKMCTSRYFTHFYTPEVVEEVRRRWSEETAEPGHRSTVMD